MRETKESHIESEVHGVFDYITVFLFFGSYIASLCISVLSSRAT